jgi:hypothetical protein
VALVGEAGRCGGRRDRLAGFEESAGGANSVSELERVGWEACAVADEANEPELPDAGGGGELVEADVSLGLVGEVLAPSEIARSSRALGVGRIGRGAEKRSITARSQVASRSSHSSLLVGLSKAMCI